VDDDAHQQQQLLSSFNPLLQTGLSVNVSQPLIRDLAIDPARQQLLLSRTNRDIADTRLRESLVHTTANVKARLEPGLGAPPSTPAARLELAQGSAGSTRPRSTSDPRRRSTSSRRRPIAANQEQLIIAETSVKRPRSAARADLRPDRRDSWNVRLDPVDSPPVGPRWWTSRR
jgi:hypothetical protein